MITQPNPGHGIMVTFNMVPSIARLYATICICFVDGAVAGCLVVLDCLEEGYESGLLERPLQRGQRGCQCVEEANERVAFFYRAESRHSQTSGSLDE
jgi:hypothetical protein